MNVSLKATMFVVCALACSIDVLASVYLSIDPGSLSAQMPLR